MVAAPVEKAGVMQGASLHLSGQRPGGRCRVRVPISLFVLVFRFHSSMSGRRPGPARRRAAPVSLEAKGSGVPARREGEEYGEACREPGGAVLPRVVFLLLLALLGTWAAVEIRNWLRRPSLLRVGGTEGAGALVFYQKGSAPAREAWLFDEPQGTAGPPRLIQRIDCRPQLTDIGEIRWTADRRAVYAAGRTPQSRGVPVVRWLFELEPEAGSKKERNARKGSRGAPGQAEEAGSRRGDGGGGNGKAEAGAGRLYLASPDYGLPGRTAFVEPPAALTERWRSHGGAGPVAAVWYDLGAMGPPLFSWQATRWENGIRGG